MDQGFDKYVKRLAERNKAEAEAQLFEPRAYWDEYAFDGSTQVVQGASDAFRNGERFPIRITHLTAAMRYSTDVNQTPVGGDERLVQRYGLRVKSHGTYYQNQEHTPLPLLHNVVNGASPVSTAAQSSWKLPKPVVIGNRDALEARVELIAIGDETTERVTVTFNGVGLYSRLPKRLVGTLEISDTDEHVIDANQLRNDGREPIEITEVVVHHAPSVDVTNPVGLVRKVRLRIRNPGGNGTGQWWVVGPATATSQLVDAPLVGVTCGRAVIHKLPCDGWLLYPGEGFDTEMRSYVPTRIETVLLGALGYVIVL